MKEFSVIDESFDPSISTSYFLSILISADGFSYCTLDPIQNLFIQFKHFEYDKPDHDLRKGINLLQSESHLNLNYKKVFVLFQTHQNTLIPGSIYKKEKIDDIFSLTFDNPNINKSDSIISNKIKLADAYNLFAAPQVLIDDIKKKFNNVQILHSSTPFIESNLLEDQRHLNPHETNIHLSFNKSSFQVVVVENRELVLINTFQFKTDNEIIYYLFFIFDQLKLDPAKTSITIAGEILENKTQLTQLKKYVKRLTTEKPDKQFNFSPVFRSVMIPRFTNLFNSPLCV